MSGQTPMSGYVLTATDTSGDTTWTSPGTSSGWTVSGNNVYETSSGNVGIGTTTVTQGALVVTNGNVGIGTWAPGTALQVGTNTLVVNTATGNVGHRQRGATNNGLSVLGGAGFGTYATTTAPAGGIIASGNVGIGYTTPTGALAVNGNVGVGTTAPQGSLVVTNGNVGIGTWAPGMLAGWYKYSSGKYGNRQCGYRTQGAQIMCYLC